MIKDTNTISRNIEKAYNEKKYIVNYKTVYQPFYSQAQQSYYAQPVYYKRDNKDGCTSLTKPGRFFHMTGEQVNHLIGYQLLNNL